MTRFAAVRSLVCCVSVYVMRLQTFLEQEMDGISFKHSDTLS